MGMSRLILSLLLLPLLVAGATPDRDARPDEWGYRPAEGASVLVNPPALSWASAGGTVRYSVQWSTRADFNGAVTVDGIPWSVYTHHSALQPGRYFWRYKIVEQAGKASAWSRTRSFVVPSSATEFPQPALEELKRRVPAGRPRVFVTPAQLPRLKEWAKGGGKATFDVILKRADETLRGEPTPEPTVMGSASNPATVEYWWSNRVQTLKATGEAELLAFAYRMTGERRYAEGARRWILHLASWSPDGPTNWKLNCEAAKPMMHRLPRVYDWAYDTLSEQEREQVRQVMKRRARDAWMSGEIRQGTGHLNQPYNSHGNRTWHKLAEYALATLGEDPDSDTYLHYSVSKFFAAYPVWSDDDGGWHEGLSYWGGYLSRATWWMEIARTALGIDGYRKPFFANFGEYALYTAPPGSPDMGFGDLSHRPVPASWAFVRYFVGGAQNPYWAWWADRWKIVAEPDEPVMAFLWGAQKPVRAKEPRDLPPSKVFRGTGVAVLNSTLLDAADNVQIRFKSSPMGRRSHGHDPHNSFTLNAYGSALLVNNVYRDIHGSPFHRNWCWNTRAQNAVLFDNQGQRPVGPDPGGKIARWEFQNGFDYLAGDATAAYEGKFIRYLRHVVFVKPDVVLIADEIEASKAGTFQWMLHGHVPFEVAENDQRLKLEHGPAGVLVDYVAPQKLAFRHWTGYEPEPNTGYLQNTGRPQIPPQWHVEAATAEPMEKVFTVAVLRPYRQGRAPQGAVTAERQAGSLRLNIPVASGTVSAVLQTTTAPGTRGDFAVVRAGGKEWRVAAAGKNAN